MTAKGKGHAATGSQLAANMQPAADTSPRLLRRLAAQRRAFRQAASGPAWEHAPIERRRDKDGNPIAGQMVFLTPPPGDDTLTHDCELQGALSVIKAAYPGRADELAHFYNHRVVPLLARYRDAWRAAWEEIAHRNVEIERHNAALEARRVDVEAERDAKTEAARTALLALDEPLAQAHDEAAVKAAHTGGDYDAANPSPACVLRHQKRLLESLAGELSVPWTPADVEKRLSKQWLLGLSIGVGFLIGLSLGIASGSIDPTSLDRDWPKALAAWPFGFIAAYGGGWAIKHYSRTAAERYHLALHSGRSPLHWIPSTILAAFVTVVLTVMDAGIEFFGLFKMAMLEAQLHGSAAAIPPSIAVMVGMIVTCGYLLTCGKEGALDGRYHVCLNHLLHAQEKEFAARDEEVRARPAVQEALAALGRVSDLIRRQSALHARIASDAMPFETETAQIESMKREPITALSEAALRRVADAHDNFAGAHVQFRAHVMALLDDVEPLQGNRSHESRRSLPAPARGGMLGWLRRLWQRNESPNVLQGHSREGTKIS